MVITPDNIQDVFLKACEEGREDQVHDLSCNEAYRTSKGESWLTFNGEWDEYFQTTCFRKACANGHLEVVRFLTTSPELKAAGHEFVNIHAENAFGFEEACARGHLEIVRYLTRDPAFKAAGHDWVGIHMNNAEGFQRACSEGHLDVVRYLSTSQELKEAGHNWVDIHGGNEPSFSMGLFKRPSGDCEVFSPQPRVKSSWIGSCEYSCR